MAVVAGVVGSPKNVARSVAFKRNNDLKCIFGEVSLELLIVKTNILSVVTP